MNFQFKPDLVLCVGGCEAKPELPDAADWLRILTHGPTQLAAVAITAQAATSSTLTTTLGAVDLTGVKVVHKLLSAGATLPLHVPSFAVLEARVVGRGTFGSGAALAIASPKTNNFIIWPGTPQASDPLVVRLSPGQYLLCVYFGAADFPVCDARQKDAHVIETGVADLELRNLLAPAPSVVTLGDGDSDQEIALLYGTPIRIRVQSRLNVEFLVNDQLTINSPGAPILTVSGNAGHTSRVERGLPMQFIELLDAGEYLVCLNSDAVDTCKDAAADSVSTVRGPSPPGVVLRLTAHPVPRENGSSSRT